MAKGDFKFSVWELKAMPADQSSSTIAELHEKADDILLDILDALGQQDVTSAYRAAKERVGFYYV